MMNFSHSQTPRIVQPGRRISVGVWALLVLLVVSWTWFLVSKSDNYMAAELEKRDGQIEDLQDHASLLEQELDELRLRAAKYERASQVDKAAVKLIQQDIKSLQEQRATLHQEAEFLKSLVSGDVTILQLTDFKLRRLEEDRHYHYNVMVSKREKGRNRVQGKLEFLVSGQLEGKDTQLSMLSMGIDPQNMVMGFNFFQQFKGELILPEGFKPKKVLIKISPSGKKFKMLQQTFDWKTDN